MKNQNNTKFSSGMLKYACVIVQQTLTLYIDTFTGSHRAENISCFGFMWS